MSEHQDSLTILSELMQAASEPIDANDLTRLARLHGWCQSLAEIEAAANEHLASEGARALAGALMSFFEGVILNEVADPQGGLELVPSATEALKAIAAGASIDTQALVASIQQVIGGNAADATPAATSTPEAPAAASEPVAEAPAAAPAAEAPPAASEPEPVATPAAPEPAAAANADDDFEVEAYVAEPLILNMDDAEDLQGFVDEAREHMDSIEGALLEVEQDPQDAARLNELFRPFHTIKGIAGFLNLRDINRLTHEVETILDLGRKSELTITQGIIDLIFRAIDVLKVQISAVQQQLSEPTGGPCPQPDIVDIMAVLRRAAAGKLPAGFSAGRSDTAAETSATAAEEAGAAGAPEAEAPTSNETGTPASVAPPAMAGGGGSAEAGDGGGKAHVDQSIRVDTVKLDALVDAVGELVIAQTMVALAAANNKDEKLQRDVSQVTKIVRDIQETALAMRMVPIGSTFQKMKRLVRDVSRKADKNVELHISGEETELDKTVIQQISDPLVHMVRNAVDHGIEPEAERIAAGKPAVGQVTLDAYHQGDSIIIAIQDDGRGLDRDKLLKKAIERGMVTAEDQLSDQQIYQLIFSAGFSTAAAITDISGRGVGMDVVKRNIEQLRGKIDIQTELGKGSTFFIRLPLTLAIIDGMLVKVGEERLIIPTIVIEQSLRPSTKDIHTVQKRGEMIKVRGELCPLVQLGELFGYCGRVDPTQSLIVVTICEGQKVGLVVSELIGQQQVVIKTLGDRFKNVKGVSGAAILGDGRVGLILEPTGVLRYYNQTSGMSRANGTPTDRQDSSTESSSPVEAELEAATVA